jgi:hypothetical protein
VKLAIGNVLNASELVLRQMEARVALSTRIFSKSESFAVLDRETGEAIVGNVVLNVASCALGVGVLLTQGNVLVTSGFVDRWMEP